MTSLEYTSQHGYTGKLYGEKSLSIYDPEGIEIMYTRFRGFNDYETLKRIVDAHDEFITSSKEAELKGEKNE